MTQHLAGGVFLVFFSFIFLLLCLPFVLVSLSHKGVFPLNGVPSWSVIPFYFIIIISYSIFIYVIHLFYFSSTSRLFFLFNIMNLAFQRRIIPKKAYFFPF